MGGFKNIKQIQTVAYSVAASSSSATFTDTGLGVSITPTKATNSIIALAVIAGVEKAAGNSGSGVNLRLLRGAGVISQQLVAGITDTSVKNNVGSCTLFFLDNPGTTSPTTYKVQFANNVNAASVTVQANNTNSYLILMEVGN